MSRGLYSLINKTVLIQAYSFQVVMAGAFSIAGGDVIWGNGG